MMTNYFAWVREDVTSTCEGPLRSYGTIDSRLFLSSASICSRGKVLITFSLLALPTANSHLISSCHDSCEESLSTYTTYTFPRQYKIDVNHATTQCFLRSVCHCFTKSSRCFWIGVLQLHRSDANRRWYDASTPTTMDLDSHCDICFLHIEMLVSVCSKTC